MATGHTFIDGHPAGANGRVRWWTGSKQVCTTISTLTLPTYLVCVSTCQDKEQTFTAPLFLPAPLLCTKTVRNNRIGWQVRCGWKLSWKIFYAEFYLSLWTRLLQLNGRYRAAGQTQRSFRRRFTALIIMLIIVGRVSSQEAVKNHTAVSWPPFSTKLESFDGLWVGEKNNKNSV